MICSICGATCVCANTGDGVCCGCHPHRVRGELVMRLAPSDKHWYQPGLPFDAQHETPECEQQSGAVSE